MKTLILKRNLSEEPVIGKLFDGTKFLTNIVDSGIDAGTYTLAYAYDSSLKTFSWKIDGGTYDGLALVSPSEFVKTGSGLVPIQDTYISDESGELDILKSRGNPIAVRSALRGTVSATLEVEDTTSAGGGGGPIGSSIAPEQIAFATANDTVGGTSDFTWDGTNFAIKGSSANRFVRFVESAGLYNGGFIQFDGAANKMRLGTHPSGDTDINNDIHSMTLLRSNGHVGIFNDDPAFELDVTGTIHSDGVRIAPTFTNFSGKVATGGNPVFGGSRIGDSDLQTESLDVKQIYFKGDTQETKAAIFINPSGSVISVKGFDDGIQVVDFTSKDIPITESGESTIANSIRYDNGHEYINDQGVQRYVTAGSVVANTFFQVLQTRGGGARIPFWCGHYDGTTYERFYEIDTTSGEITVENPITSPDAVEQDQLATLAQTDPGTGFAVYGDAQYTDGSRLSATSGNTVVVDIDGLGTTYKAQLPVGVTDLYDVATSKITPAAIGDGYTFTLSFRGSSTSNNGSATFAIDIGGGIGEIFERNFRFPRGTGVDHDFYFTSQGYSLATFVSNGGTIQITSNVGTSSFYAFSLQVHRTHKAR